MVLARIVANVRTFRKITINWGTFLTALGSGVTITSSEWISDSDDVSLETPTNDTLVTTVQPLYDAQSPSNPRRTKTYTISNLIVASNGEQEIAQVFVTVTR